MDLPHPYALMLHFPSAPTWILFTSAQCGNILLGEGQGGARGGVVVKIADFGVAAQLTRCGSESVDGGVLKK